MNAMSRDIQFVLHQHSKSPQLSGLGPTQRFKRSLKLLCYLHARPGFEPLTLISEGKYSNHQTMKADLLEADDLFHWILFFVSQQIPHSVLHKTAEKLSVIRLFTQNFFIGSVSNAYTIGCCTFLVRIKTTYMTFFSFSKIHGRIGKLFEKICI